MTNQLTRGEKAFMKTFKHFNVTCDRSLLPNQILMGKDEFLIPPDREKSDDIIQSLVDSGYAYRKEEKPYYLYLSKKGEEYLYR